MKLTRGRGLDNSCMEAMNEISGYLTPVSDIGDSAEKAHRTIIHMDALSSNDESETEPGPVNEKIRLSASSSISKIHSSVPTPTTTSFKPKNIGRYKYIPMRLSEEERKLLAVLENALEVCEYTDVVDVTFSHTRKSKMSRIIESLVDVLSISCGLIVRHTSA